MNTHHMLGITLHPVESIKVTPSSYTDHGLKKPVRENNPDILGSLNWDDGTCRVPGTVPVLCWGCGGMQKQT